MSGERQDDGADPRVIEPRLDVGAGVRALRTDAGEPVHPGDAVRWQGQGYIFAGLRASGGDDWTATLKPGEAAAGSRQALPLDRAAAELRLAAPTREAVHACMHEAARRGAAREFTREDLNAVMAERGYPPFADHEALSAFLDEGRDVEAELAIQRELEKLIAPVMQGHEDMHLGRAAAELGMTVRELWAQATVNAKVERVN